MLSYVKTSYFLSLLLASLSSVASPQAAPPNPQLQPAVDLVTRQYSIDPLHKVPSTKKPLPTTGTWSATTQDDGLPFLPACSAPASCVQVLCHEPSTSIVCRWTVLLQPDSGAPLIIDQDASATQYTVWQQSASNQPNSNPGTATPVQFVSGPNALIPPIARAANIHQGSVNVSMVIDANGKVEKAEALDPPSMLSDAALEAARDYVFKPATLAGKPIAARVTGRVHLN